MSIHWGGFFGVLRIVLSAKSLVVVSLGLILADRRGALGRKRSTSWSLPVVMIASWQTRHRIPLSRQQNLDRPEKS